MPLKILTKRSTSNTPRFSGKLILAAALLFSCGPTLAEKVEVIGAYHMFPERLKRVWKESGVKNIVMVHVQNYNSPKDFARLDVLNEMIDEGVKNIVLAQDGDRY